MYVTLILLMSLFSCVQKRESEVKAIAGPVNPDSVRLIAITDFHGALEPVEQGFDAGNGYENFVSGGASYLSSYLSFVRRQSGYPSVTIDGGDLFQGTFISNMAEGLPVVDVYNEIGVTAVAVGNHEFDFGPVGANNVVTVRGENPTGALEKAIGRAQFPFLAINIFDEKTGLRPSWVRKSITVEKNGVTIGIIGAASPETPLTTIAQNVDHLEFRSNLFDLVSEEARDLRNKGAQLVFLTTHIGGNCLVNLSQYANQTEKICKGEIWDLAESLLGHVNAIVAGHTHQNINKIISRDGHQLIVMEPQAKGSEIIFADISISGEITAYDPVPVCGSKILDKSILVNGHREIVRGCNPFFLQIDQKQGDRILSIKQAEIDGKKVQEDPKIASMLADLIASAEAIKIREAGATVTKEFLRNYTNENGLANMLSDLLLAATDAQIAFANNGGVRSNLSVGDVNYNDIYEIFPFDNQVVLVELSGFQIKELLSKDVFSRADEAFTWSGIRAYAKNCKLDRALFIDKNRANPIEDGRIYKVVTLSYNASQLPGMVTVPRNKPLNIKETGVLVRDLVFEEIKGKVLSPDDYFQPKSPRINFQGECI